MFCLNVKSQSLSEDFFFFFFFEIFLCYSFCFCNLIRQVSPVYYFLFRFILLVQHYLLYRCKTYWEYLSKQRFHQKRYRNLDIELSLMNRTWRKWSMLFGFPAGIYVLKVNYRNTKARCWICSKLTIKALERRRSLHSGVFVVNFEHI